MVAKPIHSGPFGVDREEVRRLDYRGASIVVREYDGFGDFGKTRNDRTKTCEVTFPNGETRRMNISNPAHIMGRSWVRYMSNAKIFAEAKASVREWLRKNPSFKPGAQGTLF